MILIHKRITIEIKESYLKNLKNHNQYHKYKNFNLLYNHNTDHNYKNFNHLRTLIK